MQFTISNGEEDGHTLRYKKRRIAPPFNIKTFILQNCPASIVMFSRFLVEPVQEIT